VGTHKRNKKTEIPAAAGIPAPFNPDYRGNFGLDLSFPHARPWERIGPKLPPTWRAKWEPAWRVEHRVSDRRAVANPGAATLNGFLLVPVVEELEAASGAVGHQLQQLARQIAL